MYPSKMCFDKVIITQHTHKVNRLTKGLTSGILLV